MIKKIKHWQKETGWSNENLFFAILLWSTVVIGGSLDLYAFFKYQTLVNSIIK